MTVDLQARDDLAIDVTGMGRVLRVDLSHGVLNDRCDWAGEQISFELKPEQARELIEKLQAALPPPVALPEGPPPIDPHVSTHAEPAPLGPEYGSYGYGAPQPIVPAHAQPDLETDLTTPVAKDDIPW